MKKFFFLAAAAVLALASCSKSEVMTNETPENAISFGTYVGTTPVKSTTGDIDITALKASADGFGVFCYYSDNGNFVAGTSTPNFMLNQQVEYKTSSAWKYSPVKYWPNEYSQSAAMTTEGVDKLTFRAYAPYSDGTTNNISNLPGESTATTTLTYTMGDDQVDLLWASNAVSSLTNLTKQAVGGKVSFTFSHALSKISFSHQAVVDKVDPTSSALDAKTTITLNSITLDGASIYKTGVFDFAAGTWASQAAGTTGTNDIALSSLNANVTEALTALSDNFFIIPGDSQTIKVTVNYDVKTTDDKYTARYVTVNNTIYKTATFSPQPGYKYVIKLLLGLTSVKLNVDEINGWTNGDATEIDLPENTTT